MTAHLEPIAAVRPSAYNPRETDPERLDLIELSLRKLGFLLPLYVDANGELLSGHQRHLVAARLGAAEVPIVRLPEMPLDKRKAVNVAFNRATNDFDAAETSRTTTAALARQDVARFAADLPDLLPNSSAFFPCLAAKVEPLAPLLAANAGRWVDYARNMARAMRRLDVRMPVVAGPTGVVVNGIGRLQDAAEQGQTEIEVVRVDAGQETFARAMLNLLSMEFDLHRRYADLLRYNSFRRPIRVRDGLGRGFTIGVLGAKPANQLDVMRADDFARWRAVYGESVVDFGAGHLHEARLLRSLGVHVAAFEPYRVVGSAIDKVESVALARAFLADIASGRAYSSVVISSVLNSVPFSADRQKIVAICAALCGPNSTLYASAMSTAQAEWEQSLGRGFLDSNRSGLLAFRLDCEPGIRVGDITNAPKVQKYHTIGEFRDLFDRHFARVEVFASRGNVEAICSAPRAPDLSLLRDAIEFEFDLPYPDSTRMGLAQDAIAAFAKRLGVSL